jgi:hypothetical protein
VLLDTLQKPNQPRYSGFAAPLDIRKLTGSFPSCFEGVVQLVVIYQHESFCPTCSPTFFPNTRRQIGSYQLRFAQANSTNIVRGQIDLRAGLVSPLSGRFDRQAPFEQLTGSKICR